MMPVNGFEDLKREPRDHLDAVTVFFHADYISCLCFFPNGEEHTITLSP